MAIIFELWAQCSNESSALALSQHFNGFQHTLSTGKTIVAEIDLVVKPLSLYGIRVDFPNLSRSGVRSLQDALETTEAGLLIYHHLKIGPDFRFARVAWEAENITMADLEDWVEALGDEKRLSLECAIDEEIYLKLGKPKFCYAFRKGYWWTRYQGENYRPLYSSDQEKLNKLCRDLFPEYFGY